MLNQRLIARCFVFCLLATALQTAGAESLRTASPSGKIAAGTRWETDYFVRDGNLPGPTIVIVGGVHGDEPAGALAAGGICRWPVQRGRLIVIPRANQRALDNGSRRFPSGPPELADLNRNFPKVNGPHRPRGELAQAMWAFVRHENPDWLIDLHEGFDFNHINPKSVGSTIIRYPSDEANLVVPRMIEAVNDEVDQPWKKFTIRGPPVDGSLARAAAVELGAESMILETTKKDQPPALRARQHHVMVRALLSYLNVLGGELADASLVAEATAAAGSE